MSMIDNDWLPCVQGEFKKPYYRELYQFIRQEYNTHVIYPPADDIFNAFHFTPLSKVKVLILGNPPFPAEYLQGTGNRCGMLYSEQWLSEEMG